MKKRTPIKRYFLTGLVILLPLMVTLAVLSFFINLLTTPFVGMASSLLSNLGLPTAFIRHVSQILILVFLFAMIVGLGMLASRFFMNTLVRVSDKLLRRIPVVNTVYKTTRDIIDALFASDKNAFKLVVMVPFPDKGIYVLGLVARDAPPICSEKVNEDLVSVLIPTTPLPTTGFLMMYKRSDLIYIDIKPEEALKYIISCGVIMPEPKIEEKT